MSSGTLKIIAAVSMFIDHAAIMLNRCGLITAAVYDIMRCAGRIAFPIFAFLIAEGFFYTKSIGKYIGRIFVAAVISEIPYDLLNFGSMFSPEHNNVLWTFAISLGVMHAISKYRGTAVRNFMVMLIAFAAGIGTACFFRTDYSWKGVTLVVLFCMFREIKPVKYVAGSVVLIAGGSVLSLAAPASFILTEMYDGRKGKLPGYAAYLFYPVHMLFLGVLGLIL